MTPSVSAQRASAVWPQVTTFDRKCLQHQLGRTPRQVAGIARRCAQGRPAVVVSYPLPRAEGDAIFFPTLFWLSCPAAVKTLSRWEDEGWIKVLQERLKSEAGFKKKMDAAHVEYLRLRQTLVTPGERERLARENPRLAKDLQARGIGGLLPGWTIKCLHLHYAHYLATRHNPVGQWVEKRWSLAKSSKSCPGCDGFLAD